MGDKGKQEDKKKRLDIHGDGVECGDDFFLMMMVLIMV